jgi:hypothetical protein
LLSLQISYKIFQKQNGRSVVPRAIRFIKRLVTGIILALCPDRSAHRQL